MKIFKKRIVIFLTAAIMAIGALAYLCKDYIAIYAISKKYNLEISYKELKRLSPGKMEFKDLKVVEKKTALGLFSRGATITLDKKVGFDLRDVGFVGSPKSAAPSYDNIMELSAMPFNSRWTYKEISGKISQSPEGLNVDNFMATGDDIKLSFTGVIYHDNAVNADIVIYFSDRLTKKIPRELSMVVLRDEKDGWMSLTVAVKGDYRKPSIQVSSKLFRLNIKEVVR